MTDSEQLSWNQVRAALREIWGYEDFRPPQDQIIRTLLTQRDALIVLPTGGGKSICFQLPAVLRTGLTIVVSPLVALMENQVQELRQRGLSAGLLHSELPTTQRRQTLQWLECDRLRLLYLSPETLLSTPVWQRLSQLPLKINGLILDEAHCLVQWGETFRPAYRRLGAVRKALLKSRPTGSKIPMAAFTATADPEAQATIQTVLQLQQPAIFLENPYRANLSIKVQIAWTPRSRRQQLLKFIQGRAQQSGLVYVRTRRDSETLAEWLSQLGISTVAYHAGLSGSDRRQVEQKWLSGEIQSVICTSAFGMGINKSNVRWILHFHAPLFLSEYIQEIGRAGRDGQPAEALTLISEPTGWLDPEDQQRRHYFERQLRSQYQIAQQLAQKLPRQGDVNAITRRFPDGAIALSLLHSSGQLEWRDPFHYVLKAGSPQTSSIHSPETNAILTNNLNGTRQQLRYLHTRECRWKFLLDGFGFTQEGKNFHCGNCDNCRKSQR